MVELDVSNSADVVCEHCDRGARDGQNLCVWRTGYKTTLSIFCIVLEEAQSG